MPVFGCEDVCWEKVKGIGLEGPYAVEPAEQKNTLGGLVKKTVSDIQLNLKCHSKLPYLHQEKQ